MSLAPRINTPAGSRVTAPSAKRSFVCKPARRSVVSRVASESVSASMEEESCPAIIDDKGNLIQVMCWDYGFRSGGGRLYQDNYGEVPKNALEMAKANFKHEWEALSGSLTGQAAKNASSQVPSSSPAAAELRAKLAQLKLDDEKVVAREHARVKAEGEPDAPAWIKVPFLALCWVLDRLYGGKPIQRFWVLETVARIPYFSFISVLHLYESLGFWRAGAELRKIHFAEEWNEMHHLQIMEALGGDQAWSDRFVANHAAILYYWTVILFYLFSPKDAYIFSELVELHATDTYAEFVEENAELLKTLPPPMVAVQYYLSEDLYMFDTFQTSSAATEARRPQCKTMLDVFSNIRDDEVEHVRTMHACQDLKIAEDIARARRNKLLG